MNARPKIVNCFVIAPGTSTLRNMHISVHVEIRVGTKFEVRWHGVPLVGSERGVVLFGDGGRQRPMCKYLPGYNSVRESYARSAGFHGRAWRRLTSVGGECFCRSKAATATRLSYVTRGSTEAHPFGGKKYPLVVVAMPSSVGE